MKKQRGITLLALVITVIIIIILATVAINFLFGENGLITRAQQAAQMSDIENVREKLEMAKGTAVIDGRGYIDPDHYFDIIYEEGIIGDRENDVIDNGNGTYEVTTVEGYIFIITLLPTPEEAKDIDIEYSGTAEGPRIVNLTTEWTTNSISIEVETRNAEGATYIYEYSISGEEKWQEAEQSKNNTCTINELIEGETYDIRVTVTTNDGSVTRKTSVHLGELPEGTITFKSEWVGDGTARVTINTSAEGYRLQYQINAIEENGWIDIDNGGTVSNLTYPSTVYARIFDGTNGSEEASETLEDKTAPSAPTISITSGTAGNNGYYKSNVTVTITGGSDAQSGANKIRYAVTGAQTIAQTDTADGTTSTNITISAEGESTITAYTLDKAGNISTVATQTINKDATAPSRASLTVGTVGETSIAVTARGADATSGIYSYEFQRSTTSTTSGFTTVGGTQTSTATRYSYTYSNLSDDTTYYLRVIVTDKAGNTRTSTAVTQVTTEPTVFSKLEEGDYVTYGNLPCRVLYDKSSGYGVQLITSKTVGNGFKIGYNNNLSLAINSYNNAISALNSETEKYNDSEYSTSRCVGSNPSNPTLESDYIFYNGYSVKDKDTNYLTDYNKMNSLGILNIGENYWLASRNSTLYSNYRDFVVRNVFSDGSLGNYCLFWMYDTDDGDVGSYEFKIRPIFILKSNIKVTGGTGEEGDPYTLGT